MSSRTRWIAVALVAAAAVCLSVPRDGGARPIKDRARIPVLSPITQRSPEGDTPPVVVKLIEQEERAALARAQAASKLTPSLAAGCRRVTDPSGKVLLGPPAPTVKARIIGHDVEVLLRYRTLPRSDACRPAAETVVVFSGEQASGSFNSAGAVETYAVGGPAGRAVLDLPWRGHAPYHLLTTSTTVLGRRGTTVKVPLACTPSGCLDGYRPALHSWPMPKPVLALSGLTRAQLESSMREVVAGQRWPSARAVRCTSLASCIVTLVTPGFPKQPYRVRYAIAGQQIPGCWLAWSGPLLDPLPYPDAGRGPLGLAGCRDWLR